MEHNGHCSHCNMQDHKIDVRGRKFLDDGTEIPYQICRGCCSLIRYFNFHKDMEKIDTFWYAVWQNLNIPMQIPAQAQAQAVAT